MKHVLIVDDALEFGRLLQTALAVLGHGMAVAVGRLREDRILFSCDFLGAHLAQSHPLLSDESRTFHAAKRYFAEIMMPFRKAIQSNLKKLRALDFDMVAPSHGPAVLLSM